MIDEQNGHFPDDRGGQQDGEPSGGERSTEPGAAAGDGQRQPKRKGSFWRELPILVAVAVVVALVVRAFVVQTFYIPTGSMQQTLEINDRVLVNKLVYEFRTPRRGEIVVFEAPPGWRNTESEDFVKRVIGVGGDRVACCDQRGRITVNGEPIDETEYLFKRNGVSDPPASQEFEVTVPPGRLWVMGDHRSGSADSLEHFDDSDGGIMESTISVDAVVGRAFALFWPVGRARWLSVPGTFDDVPDPPR